MDTDSRDATIASLREHLATVTRERDLLAKECGAARKYRAAMCRETEAYDSDGDWQGRVKDAQEQRGKAWAQWCEAKKANDDAGVKVEAAAAKEVGRG